MTRPIVRSFNARFVSAAAAHVRAGGHAVVWEAPRRARLYFPRPADGDESDLGWWAVLDLGKLRWDLATRAPFRGLGTALVPRAQNDIVARWIERDSAWPGTTRTVAFDCLACGACCRDNFVTLLAPDVERFVAAGRADLTRPPLARKKNGKLSLVLLRSKDCRFLGEDNRCGIYTIRPDACSEFPVGSECCLYAREEELGLYDGLAPAGS